MAALSYFNPPGYSSYGVVNSAAWRGAQVPSTNGHASAPGLAAFYGALLGPDALLGDDLRDEATAPRRADRARSSGRTPPSASASPRRHLGGPWDPTLGPSATSGPAVRSASPTRTPAWPSATS